MRQMANGSSAGSRRTCCSLPVQMKRACAHQILDGERPVVGKAPFPQRQFEHRLLHVVRIEADRHQDHVAMRRQRLAVEQDLIVEGIVERKPEMGLQRRMRLADAVERGDLGDDVAGRAGSRGA